MDLLQAKTAFVTGAADGIGRASALGAGGAAP
jgi:NAD(P)-dependent dehydrogenase (short-subunit alcohol dehydrogenase family)